MVTTDGFDVTTVVSGLAVVPLGTFVVLATLVVSGPGPVVIPVIHLVLLDLSANHFLI